MREHHQLLIHQLKELPDIVQKAELEYYDYQKKFQEIKQCIAEVEVRLYNEGKVDSKNELTRTASFLPHTEKLHKERIKVEYEMNKSKSEYYKLKYQMENIQIILRLITKES
jgi:hypothetical protein